MKLLDLAYLALLCWDKGSALDFVICLLQTIFIISVCNNQLLNWIENELIWVFSFVPGFESILPNLVAKLHAMKDKYMATPSHGTSNLKVSPFANVMRFIFTISYVCH